MTNDEREAEKKRLKELDMQRWRISMDDRMHGRLPYGSPRWNRLVKEYYEIIQELVNGSET